MPQYLKMMYVWGHSYEFDIHNTWDRFEQFCSMISGQDDIFYGTNKNALIFSYFFFFFYDFIKLYFIYCID